MKCNAVFTRKKGPIATRNILLNTPNKNIYAVKDLLHIFFTNQRIFI